MRIGMAFGSGLIPQGNLSNDTLTYAKQLGISDIVLHLPDQRLIPSTIQGYWEEDDMVRIRKYVESFGMKLSAIENFPVFHWYDVLLDGPAKKKQIENLKKTISNMGRADIPVMGYYFSLAGVWGRQFGAYARGEALTDAFSLKSGVDFDQPIPGGEVWGEKYDTSTRAEFLRPTTTEEVWGRLEYFLQELIPVAAESNVRLAAHPDDPPVPTLRRTGRILTRPDDLQRLLDICPSYYNALEFCQGTIAYMSEGNIYEIIKKYALQDRIAYVHMRNSKGRFPEYVETFLDDGDHNIPKCLKTYSDNGFDGLIIPDHNPRVSSDSPALTGFAHAIGYLRACLQVMERPLLFIAFVCSLITGCSSEENADTRKQPAALKDAIVKYLSPEESMKTFVLPAGYRLELVASEPMIAEPVAITWDGNARMYVAEMNTYMQDADATGEQELRSRIMLLEDTNHDGRMDKSSVFADSLLLPRMMQCVDHELLVNETNSINIYSYRDTNGDGRADVRKLLFSQENYLFRNVNIEHQRSGLDWNLDNWMYVTTDPVRFRYTSGIMEVDTLFSEPGGQWGLTHDDYGRLFYSSAGGEIPVLGCQLNPSYGSLYLTDTYSKEFGEVFPIIPTPDVQGGTTRLRSNSTLNHFTASCGQSIFRGDRLPDDLYGDYLVCDPVARIIRRAEITNANGKIIFENVYDQKEFIASSDMNFRPVNTATGPDGNLYIVDMHRGIIQQGAWVRPGSYLRHKIDSLGLEKNTGHGRIYRLRHKDFMPGPPPEFLDKDPYALLPYLDHPNGWWRDNAQKQIIAIGDKSIVTVLRQLAAGDGAFQVAKPGRLGRLHALWTLDGMDPVDKGTLLAVLKDKDPQIRKSAIRLSEPKLKWNDPIIIQTLHSMIDDPDIDVRLQLLASLHQSTSAQASEMIRELLEKNNENEIFNATERAINENDSAKAWGTRLAGYDMQVRKSLMKGSSIFRSTCSTCHGPEGKGLKDNGKTSTPSLFGSSRLHSDQTDNLIRILLNGMEGPVNGKSYSGAMPAMGTNDDEWIASCINYLHYSVDSSGVFSAIKPAYVGKIRSLDPLRGKPWTSRELESKKVPDR